MLYLLLRGVMAAQAANALSLLITAVANTTANRWFTFGIRGRARRPAPGPRPDRFRHRAGDHLRRAGGAACHHRPDRASFGGGSGDASRIASWVESHFSAETVGGVTVYNLAGQAASL